MPTLHFKGKTFVQNHHLAVKYHQLVPKKELSLTDNISLHDNLIIQGDNLKALKTLLPTYAGKVKCIYIDPPYNTGNENWVYNDNVNSPMLKEWLGKVVDKEDMTRHDKWLCMMMPRLRLLKELLSSDGYIFISIDDNEIHRLRCLADEIFGEENYINSMAVRRGIKNVQSQFENIERLAVGHEYVLCYTRTKFRLPKLSHILKEEEVGKWDTFWRGTDRPTMRYEIFGKTPETGQWRWEEDRAKIASENYQKYLKERSKEFTLDEFYIDHLTATNVKLDFLRINDDKVVQYYVAPRSFRLMSDNWMDISIRGTVTEFETEKHVDVIKRCIDWATKDDKDALVLDSFAGSGTTAHAVLELNKEDGGNRKFILVEQEDYADSITAERVRRVIKGVKTAKSENLKKGTGGTFSYFKLGDSIEMESILTGERLPSYEELARYIFYTATGQEFHEKKINRKTHFIGETAHYELYMLYEPDIDWLKQNALTLDGVRSMPKYTGKQRMVFAPAKYVDDYTLLEHRIDFCQLPFEIYRIQR